MSTILVESLTLNQSSIVKNIGDNYNIDVTVLPDNADNKVLKLKSSNENVAVACADGTVFNTGVGTASITLSTTDGSDLSVVCMINSQSKLVYGKDDNLDNQNFWTPYQDEVECFQMYNNSKVIIDPASVIREGDDNFMTGLMAGMNS